MFPVFLELKNQLVLVVGAGPVGWRRMEKLLEAQARIRLVCLNPPDRPVPPLVECLVESYHSQHLSGIRLAIAAAPDLVNRQVVADARQRGIWVNSASNQQDSDFHVPAQVRRGDLLIALTTNGTAPGLSRVFQQTLEETFDDSHARWVAIVGEMRPLILQLPVDQQRTLFNHLAEPKWLERLRQEKTEIVRQAMFDLVQGRKS